MTEIPEAPVSRLRELIERGERRFKVGPRRRFAIVSFAAQGVNVILLFGISVLTARLLGADGKGIYSAWTMAALGGAALLGGSVPVGLGRGWLQGDRPELVSTSIKHMLVAATPMLVLAPIGLVVGLPPVPLIATIVIGVPLTIAINDLLYVLLAAKRPFALHSVRLAGTLPLAIGLGFIAWQDSLDPADALDAAFILYAAGAGISVLIALAVTVRSLGLSREASVREYGRLGEGAYLGIVSDWAVARADRFVVVGFAGTAALGIYSVAVNFAEMSILAGVAIAQSLFEDENTLNRSESIRVLKLNARIVTVASTIVIGAAFFLIGPIFGDEFESARWVSVLLLPGVIARAISMTGGSMLLAQGRGHANSRITVVAAGVALPLWVALTIPLGVEGAALAVTLSYFVQLVLVLRTLFSASGPLSAEREGAPA